MKVCGAHQPKFSDFFDLCLHWVSVVRDLRTMTRHLIIITRAANKSGRSSYRVLNSLLNVSKTGNFLDPPTHRLRTPNEGINQRYLKNWADVADKVCFGRT